eukprot:CAMPEP_0119416356 /NCGR_PEP_ID=MMETSP1335-20130426/12747_1 /TAXON_ID=259385 /ORGANISM="Chrysoculter rhomboideus, Strain RCC1486" /LENGTH=117 /DNA_ID=CAMNT_0007441475 /DNA_START=75 /DNA_END=428 /DNA_ORIENTATION=-
MARTSLRIIMRIAELRDVIVVTMRALPPPRQTQDGRRRAWWRSCLAASAQQARDLADWATQTLCEGGQADRGGPHISTSPAGPMGATGRSRRMSAAADSAMFSTSSSSCEPCSCSRR